ncbi:hypothetical protein LshimejAT787_0603740 [Lyophyllum shimeji]|uniref:DUF6532 domain-containing protein n=1 Tax=Lyophyllum shimeji TaxID=47721 RepID=A0A9P3PPW2_LYOSH|nr:hypothetical protein LshimejAT787_0603740 [Lyophyllum shimeji]
MLDQYLHPVVTITQRKYKANRSTASRRRNQTVICLIRSVASVLKPAALPSARMESRSLKISLFSWKASQAASSCANDSSKHLLHILMLSAGPLTDPLMELMEDVGRNTREDITVWPQDARHVIVGSGFGEFFRGLVGQSGQDPLAVLFRHGSSADVHRVCLFISAERSQVCLVGGKDDRDEGSPRKAWHKYLGRPAPVRGVHLSILAVLSVLVAVDSKRIPVPKLELFSPFGTTRKGVDSLKQAPNESIFSRLTPEVISHSANSHSFWLSKGCHGLVYSSCQARKVFDPAMKLVLDLGARGQPVEVRRHPLIFRAAFRIRSDSFRALTPKMVSFSRPPLPATSHLAGQSSMAPRQMTESPAESSEEEDEVPLPRRGGNQRLNAPKKVHEAENEDEDEVPPPRGGKRQSKASEKVKHIEKENLEKAEQALLKAKKRLENLKKSNAKKSKNTDPTASAPEEPESEDDDDARGIAFSSSITALQPMVTPQAKTPTIRRIDLKKKTLPTSQLSRRDFLHVPATPSPAATAGLPGDAALLRSDEDEDQAFPDNDSVKDNMDTHPQPPTPSSSNKRPRSLSDPAVPQNPKKAKQLLPIVLRPGLDLTKAPALTDFSDVKVQALLLRAMREYEALICTKGAFPRLATRVQWADTCWINAQNDACPDDARYELTDRMHRLMQKRGSRVRSDLLDDVRTHVVSSFGFSAGGKARVVRKNAKIASSLTKDQGKTFHYKDPKAKAGYCENPIIGNILAALWFKDTNSPGIIFQHHFNPISINTLALIFTLINFCIKEWDTGKFKKAVFSEKLERDTYRAICIDLDDWQNLSLPVTTNRRKKLFNRAMKNAGVVEEAPVQPELVGEDKERARKELEGHTGDTDSEAGDDDMEVDGEEEEDP